MLTDDEILALHRALLSIPSVSGDEKAIDTVSRACADGLSVLMDK